MNLAFILLITAALAGMLGYHQALTILLLASLAAAFVSLIQ